MFRLAHQLTAKDQLKISHFSQLYAGYGHVANRTHKKNWCVEYFTIGAESWT